MARKKKEEAKGNGEEKEKKHDLVKEAAGKQFLTEQKMSAKDLALAHEIAKVEGIPVTGITILGGKPYVNVTGLDRKMEDRCKKTGRGVRRKVSLPIKRADNKDLTAGYIYIIELE